MWDTWPCQICRATAGLCRAAQGFPGPVLSSKGNSHRALVAVVMVQGTLVCHRMCWHPTHPCPQCSLITELGGGSCWPWLGHGWCYTPSTGCPALPLSVTQPEVGKVTLTRALESPSQAMP